MPEEKAKGKAQRLNKLVKHPTLNYRAVRTSEREFGVGQFLGDNQVATVA